MELAIVIPVHNEAGTIGPLLDETVALLGDGPAYEVIVVDDGSTDASPDELAVYRERYPHLAVIRHRQQAGQSAALVTGIEAARAATIITMDGDGQNDPADIPLLLRMLHEASDVRVLVTGERRRRRDNALRRLSSRIANAVRSRVLADATPDTGCGLKAFARATFLELPRFDHMHRFLPALVRRQGGRVLSVAVNHRPRAGGRSKYGVHNRLWTGLVDLLGVSWLQRRALRPVMEKEET